MSSLALAFIVLPFVLLGGFYFIALLNYELVPWFAALPKHQRMALLIWGGFSLIASTDMLSTHYGIPGALASFCLTFFGIPLVGIGLALLGALVYQGSASLSAVLDDDTGIGTFLAWVTLPILGALFFGPGPGSVVVGALLGSALFFGLLATFGAVYAVAKALDCIDSTGDAFQVPGWWGRVLVARWATRQRFWGIVERCGLVRASEYRAIHDNEEESYQRALVAEHLSRVIEADNLILTQECYQREVQVDCLCSEIEAVEVECATYQDDVLSQGRRFAGALAGKDLQIDKLRVERDTLTAQLESTDAGLFALYSGDLAHEVDRAVETSARIAAVRVLVSPALPYITPGERFALVRALEG
jgi:hypothetical protein